MPLTPSQRPTREWPLLFLSVLIVGVVCYSFMHLLGAKELKASDLKAVVKVGDNKGTFKDSTSAETQPGTAKASHGDRPSAEARGSKDSTAPQANAKPGAATATWLTWPIERWTRLLVGPEQIACYCCFIWGLLIFVSHYREVRRQRRAFGLAMLPTDDGARILQEDARPMQRRLDTITAAGGPYILGNMIRAGLAKYALSRSSHDVRETLKTQADVDLGRLVASMATLNYLAWALPAIGFFGTVRGLAGSMTLAERGGESLRIATQQLTVAFDCTLVALALSLVIMFVIHVLQREEESLVFDCQQYCLEHLVNRLYEPELANHQGMNASHDGMMPGTVPERVAR